MNYGKLRASWARVGNDTDPYQLVNTYHGGRDLQHGLPTFTVPGALRNSRAAPGDHRVRSRWARSWASSSNRLGLDLTLLHARRPATRSCRCRSRASTGYASRIVNAGTVQNRGVEVLLRGEPVRTDDFRWESTVTWSKNNSKVVELAEGVDGLELTLGDFWGVQQFARVGEPLGQLVGTAYQRDPDGNIVVSRGVGVPLWTTDDAGHRQLQPRLACGLRQRAALPQRAPELPVRHQARRRDLLRHAHVRTLRGRAVGDRGRALHAGGRPGRGRVAPAGLPASATPARASSSRA